jgi:hypothetical protein
MRARVGDRIILAAEHIDEPTRDGEILEIRGGDGAPPYLVRWADGHTGLIYPGPGAVLRIGTDAPARAASTNPVPTTVPTTGRSSAQHGAAAPGHVREWNVRISIFEGGTDTSANVVLLSDSPQHLSARGTAHLSAHDVAVPEIGGEVAVARALRHLADKLMETAETDVSELTGEGAHIRAV